MQAPSRTNCSAESSIVVTYTDLRSVRWNPNELRHTEVAIVYERPENT